jgi:hypothetical protein
MCWLQLSCNGFDEAMSLHKWQAAESTKILEQIKCELANVAVLVDWRFL